MRRILRKRNHKGAESSTLGSDHSNYLSRSFVMTTFEIILSCIGLVLCAIIAGLVALVVFGIVCAMFKKGVELDDFEKWEEEQ